MSTLQRIVSCSAAFLLCIWQALAWSAAPPALPPGLVDQAPGTWVKRSPLPGGPPSPRLGYESSWGYDPRSRLLLRWGGHNQGGGGEQNAEMWTFDLDSGRWALRETNDAPPGVCCAQQDVFDLAHGRFVRFPAFSGSHGWQWSREIALKNSSVWAYDPVTSTWRDMRPVPEPRPSPLRCASYDSDHNVIVVFAGENNREGTLAYDLHANTWTALNPPEQPPFRSGGNMTYHEHEKLHILFGSQFTNDPVTWAFDLEANRWTDLKPKGRPPSDRNDAVLTYDPVNRVVLAVLRVSEGKGDGAKAHLETWALERASGGKDRPAAWTWTKRNPPREPPVSGNRARLLTFLPDHNLAVLETRTHPPSGPAEQQIWTYRHATPTRGADDEVVPMSAHIEKNIVILSWKHPPGARSPDLTILRGEGEQSWRVAMRPLQPGKARPLVRGSNRPGKDELELTWRPNPGTRSRVDRMVKPGVVYHYTLRNEGLFPGWPGIRSRLRLQPKVVEDVVASVLSEKKVELAWKSRPDDAVVGYHVERAPVEVWTDDQLVREKKHTPPLNPPSVAALRRIGSFVRLTKEPVRDTRWTDEVDLSAPVEVAGKAILERRVAKEQIDPRGRPYPRAVFAYRVRAVNALGTIGGPSPYVLTIPAAPQHVFSREQGAHCDLKWAANPERNLRGYRVYRLDGRWDSQSVSRLTLEPIARTAFTDGAAGRTSRRYHVVAVDALGQEGIPSAPVWFEREWKSFYRPFVKEWHQ
jgi:hypothetical protein